MRTLTVAVLTVLLAATPASAAPAPGVDRDLAVVPGEFLVRSPAVVTADMDEISDGWYLLSESTVDTPSARAATLSQNLKAMVIPNRLVELASDPLITDQWALENTGQTGGTVDADIDIDDAWQYTSGDPTVVIAVIDTGVELAHPDLASRLWVNPGETPGNGVDDDNNGYVDDVSGWDFAAGDNQPNDNQGHGTAVSGVAAAALNGVGTVGVAPNVRIMPLLACNPACPISTLVEAVAYARNNGADIINMSLGGTGPYFDPLYDAVAASPGVVVTAAAGNTGSNTDSNPFYPAGFALPNVLSVASTNQDDLLSSFSSYGPGTVDLAAPGEAILSTVIGGWGNVSGTSFSSPHVAGVAALVMALRPDAIPTEVIDFVFGGVDPLAVLSGKVATGGRLNAGSTVFSATAPVAIISGLDNLVTSPANLTFSSDSSYDPAGTLAGFTWRLDGTVISTASTATTYVADPGGHELTLTIVDDDGLETTATAVVDLNGAPTITATATPSIGLAPVSVDLTAVTTDPDGDSVGVTWGSVGTALTSTPTFTERGQYRITGTADDGITTTQSSAVVVFVGEPFFDAMNSPFVNSIAWASAVGITRGCGAGNFCPARTMTRGEAAAFLTRWMHLPPGEDAFADDSGHPFEPAIDALAAAGLTFGCGPERFCPDSSLTRGQWVALVARALALPGGPDRFGDDDNSIFEPAINAAAAAGLTRGCNPPTNSDFCPSRPVTRAEVAAMLYRASVLLDIPN